jgi:RNA polymerase sigma factor (sigma-70 family)
MMTKEILFKRNEKKILSLIRRYRNVIQDYDVEDLYQELLTHIDAKLPSYDESKASIDTFVYMVAKNKLYNMANSKHNRRDVLMDEESLEELSNDFASPLSRGDSMVLEIAWDLMRNNEHKDILKDLTKSLTQQATAEKYKVSQQKVSKIWKDFIEDVKNEL